MSNRDCQEPPDVQPRSEVTGRAAATQQQKTVQPAMRPTTSQLFVNQPEEEPLQPQPAVHRPTGRGATPTPASCSPTNRKRSQQLTAQQLAPQPAVVTITHPPPGVKTTANRQRTRKMTPRRDDPNRKKKTNQSQRPCDRSQKKFFLKLRWTPPPHSKHHVSREAPFIDYMI